MSETPRTDALEKSESHNTVAETRYWCNQYKTHALLLERELGSLTRSFAEANRRLKEYQREQREREQILQRKRLGKNAKATSTGVIEMSDRFRELAEKILSEIVDVFSERSPTDVVESALRKLADEIREEDARICHQEAAAAIAGCQSRHHQFIAEGCEECAEAIRAKKTKPPSEIEP